MEEVNLDEEVPTQVKDSDVSVSIGRITDNNDTNGDGSSSHDSSASTGDSDANSNNTKNKNAESNNNKSQNPSDDNNDNNINSSISSGVQGEIPPGFEDSCIDSENEDPHSARLTFVARRRSELRHAYRVIRKCVESSSEASAPLAGSRGDGRLASSSESIIDMWLVFSVNHFSLDQERVLVLTDRALIRVKFDFFNRTVTHLTRTPLHAVLRVQCGTIGFPDSSVMKKTYSTDITKYKGVRIFTGLAPPSFTDRWNPWSKAMPYATYRAHTCAAESPVEGNAAMERMAERIIDACKRANNDLEVIKKDGVVIESYAGFFAQVYNEGFLGAQKVRGPVSF